MHYRYFRTCCFWYLLSGGGGAVRVPGRVCGCCLGVIGSLCRADPSFPLAWVDYSTALHSVVARRPGRSEVGRCFVRNARACLRPGSLVSGRQAPVYGSLSCLRYLCETQALSALRRCPSIITALLIAQGENTKYIQWQPEHASVQTRLDRYGHLLSAIHQEAQNVWMRHFLEIPLATEAVGAVTQHSESPDLIKVSALS